MHAESVSAPGDRAAQENERAWRWSIPIQLLGVLVFLACVLVFVAALPQWFEFLQTPCAAPCEDERMTVTQWFYAHRAGISPSTYAAAFVVQAVVLAGICLGVAGLLLWRRPRDPMVALVVLILLLLGGTFFSIDEVAAAETPRLLAVVSLLNSLGVLLLPLLFYLFPDGRFTPRWTRWVMLATAVVMILLQTTNIAGLDRLVPFALALYALPPIYAQLYRYRFVSGSVQRQQTKWVMYGLIVAIALFFAVIIIDILFDSGGRMAPAWKLGLEILLTVGMALIPLTIGVSVLRYRLFDIDLLIRRTVQYTIVTALLALAYAGSVLLLQRLLGAVMERPSQLAVVLSTLAIAALFNPLRGRVQGWIEARFHRSRYNARQVLEKFSQAARDETDVHRLSREMERVVQETIQPARVSVWLRDTSEERSSMRRF